MKEAEFAGRGSFQITAVAESLASEQTVERHMVGLAAELDLTERLAMSVAHAKPRHAGELLVSEITEVEQINDN